MRKRNCGEHPDVDQFIRAVTALANAIACKMSVDDSSFRGDDLWEVCG